MSKISPEDDDEKTESGYTAEVPPPGWVEDADAGPPELEEAANEDFLAESRKRRAAAIASKGQRRYNLAIRIMGGVVLFNMLVTCLPLFDGIYAFGWSTVSGKFSSYAINHFNLIDASAASGTTKASFAPYEHYSTMYLKYDTAFFNGEEEKDSFVLEQPGAVSPQRALYCALVEETRAAAALNGESIPEEAWCGSGVDVSYAFLCLELVFAVCCFGVWLALATGQGDVPPTRTIETSPPTVENPTGKHFTVTCYHAAGLHLLQGVVGIVGCDQWERHFITQYSSTECAKNVCPRMGRLYDVSLGTCLVSFLCALFYRAISRQNHVFTLRAFVNAAKEGDTFSVLKLAGESWFLRYVDELDPDGSGKNALHWATRRGEATMAQILVQSGADPRIRDSSGWSAMHYTARYGHAQALKNLLGSQYGEELVHAKESLGSAPLHLCAQGGHLDCAHCLVNSSGKPDVNVRNAFGQTPLMLAAQRGGRGDAMLDMLITAGADPKRRDQDGSTAFHYAAAVGDTYALERLLRAAYRASLGPYGGRPRPAVTLQAGHNGWGETAADEANARGKANAKELLLANLDLYNIDDRERLKPYGQQNSTAAAEQEFFEVNEDTDEDEDEELDGGVVGWASVAKDAVDYKPIGRTGVAGSPRPSAADLFDTDGDSGDEEKEYNNAAVLESALRRRWQNS